MSHFAAQQPLFRAYDIRGDQRYFTADFITALGKAFAKRYKSPTALTTKPPTDKPTVVIGFDVRNGSDSIAQSLVNTLQQHGLTVIHLGLITTPIMAFWAQHYDGHGIMVTASHSAKGILGIKWLVNNTSPSHDDIEHLYHQLSPNYSPSYSPSSQHGLHNKLFIAPQRQASPSAQAPASPNIDLPKTVITSTYIDAIKQVFASIDASIHTTSKPAISASNHRAKLNLTLVIDCMHGATSHVAAPLFNALVERVILLNDTPNGDFPTGNPDPTEPNRLAELQQVVIVNEADVGLAFDGDGDRLMVVDNSGKLLTPDHLLYLLAQVALTERPKSKIATALKPPVLFDIKCSHHLSPLLTALGATPIMTKTGSSLLRRQLQTNYRHAIFAGELSGHFIFNDGYFMAYDDAMYAGLRLLHWLAFMATKHSLQPTVANTKNSNKKNRNKTDNKNTNKSSNARLTDVWGTPKSSVHPYTLRAITQSLPAVVSTADHYLPLPTPAHRDCNMAQHLATLCQHLQPLISATSGQLSAPDDINNTNSADTSAVDTLSSCDCFANWHRWQRHIQQLLPVGTQLSCIDGVRLDFAKGFGVLRKSNTSHSLTVRFAGDSIADLKAIQARFVALLRIFDVPLSAQIAAIGCDAPVLSPAI